MKVHLNKCCHENNTEEIEFQTTSSNIQFDVTKQPSESSVLAEKCYLNVSAKKSRTENINNNGPINKNISSGLLSHVVRTSQSQKAVFDEQIARMIFATNSSFQLVEHPEFQKLMLMLRPGYSGPTRKDVADKLLTIVFDKEKGNVKNALNGEIVNIALDGWSNVHKEPIICVTVTTETSDVYLADTIDTSGIPHTSEYLEELAVSSIKNIELEFGCRVGSIVTDNAAYVSKMRHNIESRSDIDVVTYGCSAHLMNLLAHDLEIDNVKDHIVNIVKYFRNHHFALAEYRKAGGQKLVLPQDTRWNTMCDCLKLYIANWSTLLKICESNRAIIDTTVQQNVSNLVIKRSAEDLLARLEPIAFALDKAQSNKCKIADVVEVWKNLENKLLCKSEKVIQNKFKKRYDKAVTPSHFLANLLHPHYQGRKLNEIEKNTALEYANLQYPHIIPTVMKFRGKSYPFLEFEFRLEVLTELSSVQWWRSHRDNIESKTLNTILQLMTAVASSAGVERVFSSYGLVHSKLRNRLGTEKAAKLVFLFKAINQQKIIQFDVDE
ncbi:uncharacterized protein LOC136073741 [Hydra vulgaris]|uniref:uncharacterized protein LOC136073741 n=1 Tax=Hydra vulgaris TaxID=6087 RepID=UPI0032EA63BF